MSATLDERWKLIDQKYYELMISMRELGRSLEVTPNPRERTHELFNRMNEIRDLIPKVEELPKNEAQELDPETAEKLYWVSTLLQDARVAMNDINHRIDHLDKIYMKSRYIG